ncbi:TPA: hypothetical protein ACOECI_000541 [Stenotrophomonas maltophilia]
MSRTGEIRAWFERHGGEHRLSDVLQGMRAHGREKTLVAATVCGLARDGVLTATGEKGRRLYSLSPGRVFEPSRAKRIRLWLDGNPGWHFAADICDGMQVDGPAERARYARSLSNMVGIGLLQATGRATLMKYRKARNAYYRPTEGSA